MTHTTKNQVKAMVQAIEAYACSQSKVDDLTNQIEQSREAASTMLLRLAQLHNDVEVFLETCKAAEQAYKEAHKAKGATADTVKLPRAWINAKSQIKTAMLLGIDLKQFDKEYDLRQEVAKARKAAKGDEETTNDTVKSDITKDVMKSSALQVQFDAFAKVIHKVIKELDESVALEILAHAISEADELLNDLVPVEPVKIEELTGTDKDLIEELEKVQLGTVKHN